MASKADLTRLYVETRDRIAARKAEFDAADGKDKELLRQIELVLMAKMDEDGEESIRTPFGTAFITTVDYANVASWDSFIEYVKANDAFDLIEKRCSKTGVRAVIEATNAPPPGINYGQKREVGIRRPTRRKKKGEADAPESAEASTEAAETTE